MNQSADCFRRPAIMKRSRFFAKLSLRSKFFIAPAVVLGCLVVVAGLAYVGLAKQRDALHELQVRRFAMYRASADLLRELTRVHEGMLRVMAWSQVGYSDDRINNEIAEQVARLDAGKATVQEVLARNDLLPAERAAYEGLAKPLADYRMWSQRVMDMANSDIATAAVYLGTAELKFTALKGVLTKLEDLEIRSSDRYYANAMTAYDHTILVLFVGIGCAVVIAVVTTFVVTGTISRPVNRVVAELSAITDGEWNLTRRIPIESSDEVAVMTAGINSFVEKLQSLIQKLAKSTQTLSLSSGALSGIAQSLSNNTHDTMAATTSAAATTQRAAGNVNSISRAAGEMSAGVKSVAEAIDCMSSSLGEVVRRCRDETSMAAEANHQAAATSDLMVRLGQSSMEIGKIVVLIKTIASQTNLLALNANIEAASAGSAGKGFAIVAREVKELALKTAQATSQIESQIERMQDDTSSATTAIAKIKFIISEVNNISQIIVSAIEELSQTTRLIAESTAQSSQAAASIASNVDHSAQSLASVDKSVHRISASMEETAGEASRIASSSRGLADLSADLGKIVAQFKV